MSMDKSNRDDLDEELVIEIVDDTPEQDRGKSKRPADAAPDVPEDDEIASYSDNVQKRIKKLKYEYHEERRAKEAALRENQEAVTLARKLIEERNHLSERLAMGEQAVIEQAKRRVQAQLEQVERQYRNAYENGDTDNVLAAQKDITRLTLEQQQIEAYRPAAPQRMEPERVQMHSTQQAPNEPDEKAKTWLKSNPWFGQEEEMSGYAYGVHERLIKREGITPLSDDYYNRIDAAMRHRFPEYFEEEGGQEVDLRPQSSPRKTPVVAPARRVSASAPRKVSLTATQVALAKRLGLTPEQYAASMVKEMMNG
jgi:hypothetical protein